MPDIPTQYDNARMEGATTGIWARFHVRHNGTELLSFGALNTYRQHVIAVMEIHGPAGRGDKQHREAADSFVAAFRGVTTGSVETESLVRYGTPFKTGASRREGAYWVIEYACPLYRDFTEARPVGVRPSIPITRENLGNVLRSYYVEQVATPHNIPTLYDNHEATPTNSPWVRLTVSDGAADRIDSGPTYRTVGVLIVQVFDVVDRGTKESMQLVDQIASAFRAVTLEGIACGVPSPITIGRVEGFWQTNVTLPFTFTEH